MEYFTERGGTIAFHFSNEGITVIDAQLPATAVPRRELKKKKGPINPVTNSTHHHGDHTAGNIAFKDLATRVLAHENSLLNQKNFAIAQKTEDKQYYPTENFWKRMVRKGL